MTVCVIPSTFRQEGIRRDAELYPHGWQDLILRAILQPEYAAMSAGKTDP